MIEVAPPLAHPTGAVRWSLPHQDLRLDAQQWHPATRLPFYPSKSKAEMTHRKSLNLLKPEAKPMALPFSQFSFVSFRCGTCGCPLGLRLRAADPLSCGMAPPGAVLGSTRAGTVARPNRLAPCAVPPWAPLGAQGLRCGATGPSICRCATTARRRGCGSSSCRSWWFPLASPDSAPGTKHNVSKKPMNGTGSRTGHKKK